MQNAKKATASKAKNASTTATVKAPLTVPTTHNGQPWPATSNGNFNTALNSYLNKQGIVGGTGALTVAPNAAVVNTALPLNNPLPTCSKITNGTKRAKAIYFLLFGTPLVHNTPNGQPTKTSALQPYSTTHPAYGLLGYICPSQWLQGQHPATGGKAGTVSHNLAHCLAANKMLHADNASLVVGLCLNGGNTGNTTGAPLITLTVNAPTVS